jgi:glucan 1,3-beta-glucosidase
MSFRPDHVSGYQQTAKSLTENPLHSLTAAEMVTLFREILAKGVHGFCFSLYEEGQKPGDRVTEEQIRRRIQILRQEMR